MESNIYQISIKYSSNNAGISIKLLSFTFLKKVASAVEFARTWGRIFYKYLSNIKYLNILSNNSLKGGKHRGVCSNMGPDEGEQE